MVYRNLVLWIFLMNFCGIGGDQFSENLISEIVPALLNPKLILSFIKNATRIFDQFRNMTQNAVTLDASEKIQNRPEKSEYLKGFALKYPKKYKKQEFQSEDNDYILPEEGRSKRGVVHLANMINCATGCKPISYKGYGCYCGFLGSGNPVDGIDRCCKQHDWCYDAARCPMYLEYFVPYYWKCWYNRPYCATEHGEFGGSGSCADRLCECDRQLSMCLKQYQCPTKKAFCKSSPFRLFQNVFMLLPFS